jgi:hypothetical protein
MSLLEAVTCDALRCDAAHSLHRCCGVTRRLKDLHNFAGDYVCQGDRDRGADSLYFSVRR